MGGQILGQASEKNSVAWRILAGIVAFVVEGGIKKIDTDEEGQVFSKAQDIEAVIQVIKADSYAIDDLSLPKIPIMSASV